jgi:hypothetical protein
MHIAAKYKEPDRIWRATVAPMVADRFKCESGDRPNEKAAKRLRIVIFIVGLAGLRQGMADYERLVDHPVDNTQAAGTSSSTSPRVAVLSCFAVALFLSRRRGSADHTSLWRTPQGGQDSLRSAPAGKLF